MSEATITMLSTWAVKIIGVLVVFFVAWKMAGWGGRKTQQAMEKRGLDLAIAGFVGALVRWGIVLGATLGVLGWLGFETATFAAAVAGLGLAVGLALQGTLSNFAAGLMLLIFRPFTIGDVVSVAGVTGKVAQIGIFTTDFDTVDNRRIIVPNGAIFGTSIENITFHDTRRVDISVGAEYPADIDKTVATLMAGVKAVEGVLEDPAPHIYLDSLGGSSVDYQARVWCQTEDYFVVRERTTRAVKLALDEAGIGIPFPQMDVHMLKDVAA